LTQIRSFGKETLGILYQKTNHPGGGRKQTMEKGESGNKVVIEFMNRWTKQEPQRQRFDRCGRYG
jgi:hypothetical protein